MSNYPILYKITLNPIISLLLGFIYVRFVFCVYVYIYREGMVAFYDYYDREKSEKPISIKRIFILCIFSFLAVSRLKNS